METLKGRIAVLVLALGLLLLLSAANPVAAEQPQIGKGSCTGERACEGLTGTGSTTGVRRPT